LPDFALAGSDPRQDSVAYASSRATSALKGQQIEKAFPGLSFSQEMVHLTHAGDGINRLWAVLRPGVIMVFPNNSGVSSAGVFLNIADRVNAQGQEEGLLGLAFDPHYKINGFFYVNYTAANPRRSVISRFSVASNNPGQANANSELIILEVNQPFANHNGGTLEFGNDGYLYIAVGDGGSAGDPFGNGQNKNTLLGKILRIDVSSATAEEPYRIPSDNPFVSEPSGVRKEIWAYGLRNPWKFSFDPVTKDLWAADVGQNDFEEIDIIKPGKNYGWNIMEGLHCFPPSVQTCNQTGLEPPIFEYSHDEGCSITGGHVYRGKRTPELAGAYIYADFCSGRIWGLRYSGASVTEQALLIDTALLIPAIGIDEKGELYILAFDGNIYRFVAPITSVPSVSVLGLIAMAAALALIVLWQVLRTRPPSAKRS